MNREIRIRPNNVGVNGSCALCGRRTDPRIPVEAFLAGTFQDVCPDCAAEHAPGLSEALAAAYDRTPVSDDEAGYYRRVEEAVRETPWWEPRRSEDRDGPWV